jgi:hypothetical protein
MLGFEEANDEEYLLEPVSMLVRLSVVNGEPRRPHEVMLTLTNRLAQQTFEISAGLYTSVRLRVEACQLRNDGDDFDFCGGMFVDLPVSDEGSGTAATAYGVDVILKEEQ